MHKGTWMLVLFLAVIGMAFTTLASSTGGVLILGTWNVRGYPETSPERTVWFSNELSALDLDILCVQEIANQDRVNSFLSIEEGFSAVAFKDSSDGMDNAIFFADGLQIIDISDPGGFQHPAQAVYFCYQGLDAMLITVHLAWTDQEQRAKERDLLVDVVRQALEVDPDVIIAGDFNTTEKPGDTISGLANSLGLEVLMPNNAAIGTTCAGNTYDYILVSPDLYTEEAIGSGIVDFDDEQMTSAVSDHRPVRASFWTDQRYSDCSTWPPEIIATFSWKDDDAPVPPPLPPVSSNVQITRIFYDGEVFRVESDEYVEIKNLGDEAQDLRGWTLKDISEGYPEFRFRSPYLLEPGATIRVYTNEIHPEWGRFSFSSRKAIWNNKDPDTAALYNAQGEEVSRKSY